MIYHVTTREHWDEKINSKTYAPPTFPTERFVHCCHEKQLSGVLARYFKGVKNLLVLQIDETRLNAPLCYEPSANNELFPHLYGEINKDAIVGTQNV